MINFSKHNITKKDIKKYLSVIKSGWLTHGKYSSILEDKLKKFSKSKYCTLVSSCTAALHLSCLSLNLKKGDEVIVPAQTHVATAHAVELTGAKAVFVDVDIVTGNIDYRKIEKKINKKTKAIIIVYMAGYPIQINEIKKICKKYKLKIIEDCAHALGTKINGKHVGNFGVTGCFSFYPTKQITTGEGGAVITNNKKIYEKLKRMRAFGINKDINKRKKQGEYDVIELGNNYRMTDFQAALGFSQISNYKKNLAKRKKLAKLYIKKLKINNKISFAPYNKECSYFVFQIFLKKRDKLLKKFSELKIGSTVHYGRPVPMMTYYKKKYDLKKKLFSNAIMYGKNNISLPIYPKLKEEEIEKICKVINQTI